MPTFRKGPLLLNRKIYVKGTWYATQKYLQENYTSVKKVEFTNTTSSAGDWSGYFVQKVGLYYYLIPFCQVNEGYGFTVYTDEKYHVVSRNQDVVEEIYKEYLKSAL